MNGALGLLFNYSLKRYALADLLIMINHVHASELFSDFAPVTPAEVTQLLRSMLDKSSQLDSLYPNFSLEIMCCADIFSLLISHLANIILPGKLALISPLLKKPCLSKSDPSNFS
jgi:hypothetical protein